MKKKRKIVVEKENPAKKNRGKVIVFSIVILLLVLIALLLVRNYTGRAIGIDPNNPDDPLGIGLSADQIPTNENEMGDVGKAYIQKEWPAVMNYLSNSTYTKPLVLFYHNHQESINWISKFFIGLEPSWSWLYILTLLLWASIYTWVVRICEFVNVASKTLKIIISFLATWAISLIGLPRLLAQYVIDLISRMDSWTVQLMAIIGVFILLVTLDSFSAAFRDQMKIIKKRIDDAKLRDDVDQLKEDSADTKEEFNEKFEELHNLLEEANEVADQWKDYAKKSRNNIEDLRERLSELQDAEKSEEILTEIETVKDQIEQTEEDAEKAEERAEKLEDYADETGKELKSVEDIAVAALEESMDSKKKAKKAISIAKKASSIKNSNIREYEEKLKRLVEQERELLNARLDRR